MKYLPLLLGITVGFVAPLAAHAEPTAPGADSTAPYTKAKTKAKRDRVVVNAPAVSATPQKPQPQTRHEVTNMTVVGSHLPVVVYHYKKEMYTAGNSFAPRKAYRREGSGLDTTGASNVGGELLSLDPAFH